MALSRTLAGLAGAALLVASASTAAEYRGQDYFSLDLSKAVLSPTPLGPPAEFAPVPIEARGDRSSEPRWAREALRTEPNKVAVETVQATHPRHVAAVAAQHSRHVEAVPAQKRKGAARTHLAHRHGNPLNARAMDTRIQTWPCRSGAICNWKQ